MKKIIILLPLLLFFLSVRPVTAAYPTLSDYWQGKASWQPAFTIPEGKSGWTTGFGAAAQVVVVGQNWYLFTRHVDWSPNPSPCGKMTLAVSKSVDSGANWTIPIDILSNTPGTPQECIATDGGAYYQSSTNTWHIVYQCLAPNSSWKGCHATRVGADPLGPFTPDPQNPVRNTGEGTFDIIHYDGKYYWISFHGGANKNSFRGIAKTPDFYTWIEGNTAQGIMLKIADAVPWNVNWNGGPIGFGAGRMIREGEYWYQIAEAADEDLDLGLADVNQTWADGIFRSVYISATNWTRPTSITNPIVSTDNNLRTTDLAAAHPGYPGIFRDQSGKIYMHYSRIGYQPQNSGIFFLTLESNSAPSPTSTSKPGDIDHEGDVDIFDYNLLIGNFGKTGSNIVGDIDKNGKVDRVDYDILVKNFGQ